jgi:hypothetical protein
VAGLGLQGAVGVEDDAGGAEACARTLSRAVVACQVLYHTVAVHGNSRAVESLRDLKDGEGTEVRVPPAGGRGGRWSAKLGWGRVLNTLPVAAVVDATGNRQYNRFEPVRQT